MDQGEEVEGSDRKRDPLDFALWKAQKPDEDTAWDAPWGRGRPGWHIECSAMAEELLGLDFEIHGGGSDLVFPHHENEAAQTFAAHGAPLARLWVHNGMVRLDGAKMAKSVGNIFFLRDALAAHGRDALIMYFVGGHYRQPLDFDDDRLVEAAARVQRIREAGRGLVAGPSPPWSAPLRDASSTRWPTTSTRRERSRAVFEWVREANRVEARSATPTCARCSACSAREPAGRRETRRAAGRARAPTRARAPAARDYAEADRLRDLLRELGWEVRDSPEEPSCCR